MKRNHQTVTQALANNLATLRAAKKLSQEELGHMADVDRTYVSQIERGLGNPSINVLVRLATVLEVDLVDLLK